MYQEFLLGLGISIGFTLFYIGSIRIIIQKKFGIYLAGFGVLISLLSGYLVTSANTNSLNGWRVGIILFNTILTISILFCLSKFLTKTDKKSRRSKKIKDNCPGVILISIAFAITGNFSFFIFHGIANWLEKVL